MAKFPTAEWVQAIMDKLNNDEHYGQIARNWEGDMRYVVLAGGALTEEIWVYMDLWHGKCRQALMEEPANDRKPAFTLTAGYENFKKVLSGELDPMQALMTRKLGVQGNFATLLRNVPTVLDFVRCCREVTDSFV